MTIEYDKNVPKDGTSNCTTPRIVGIIFKKDSPLAGKSFDHLLDSRSCAMSVSQQQINVNEAGHSNSCQKSAISCEKRNRRLNFHNFNFDNAVNDDVKSMELSKNYNKSWRSPFNDCKNVKSNIRIVSSKNEELPRLSGDVKSSVMSRVQFFNAANEKNKDDKTLHYNKRSSTSIKSSNTFSNYGSLNNQVDTLETEMDNVLSTNKPSLFTDDDDDRVILRKQGSVRDKILKFENKDAALEVKNRRFSSFVSGMCIEKNDQKKSSSLLSLESGSKACSHKPVATIFMKLCILMTILFKRLAFA